MRSKGPLPPRCRKAGKSVSKRGLRPLAEATGAVMISGSGRLGLSRSGLYWQKAGFLAASGSPTPRPRRRGSHTEPHSQGSLQGLAPKTRGTACSWSSSEDVSAVHHPGPLREIPSHHSLEADMQHGVGCSSRLLSNWLLAGSPGPIDQEEQRLWERRETNGRSNQFWVRADTSGRLGFCQDPCRATQPKANTCLWPGDASRCSGVLGQAATQPRSMSCVFSRKHENMSRPTRCDGRALELCVLNPS